jgi:hypothetical protein
MSDTKSCAATVVLADCDSGNYIADNACTACGDNCMSCTDSACTTCDDGYGPNIADNGCTACTAEITGMTTCNYDLATPSACSSGYSVL